MPQQYKPPAQIRGVAALLGDDQESSNEIPLDQIDLPACQPRKYFDPDKQLSLQASIKDKGILEPLLVRPKGNRYELVAGERRYRAAIAIGLDEVPVVLKDLSDVEAVEVALIENLQRENLNPVEEVEGILNLLAIRLDMDVAGVRLLLHQLQREYQKKSINTGINERREIETVLELAGFHLPSFVANQLPLLNLPEDVLNVLREGQLAYTKAKLIGRIKDEQKRKALLKRAVDEKLSRNDIRDAVAEMSEPPEDDGVREKISQTLKLAKSASSRLDVEKRRKLEGYLQQIQSLLSD